MSDDPHKVIMSIDFGTYGFFAAFAKVSDVSTTAQAIKEWPRSTDVVYEKILNAILLRKSNMDEVLAYGFAAVDMFMEAKEEDEHEDMVLFENFKLQLLQGGDVNFDANKPIKAVDGVTTRGLLQLVSQCLGQIKDHSLNYYEKRIERGLDEREILWVLSVPAKWSLMSREAMKQCCYRVGIEDEHLMIVSEPEAAASYLMWGTEAGRGLNPGDRIAVLDCGSGTFDSGAYEITPDGKAREIQSPDGGLSGAQNIDEMWKIFLNQIFTEAVVQQYREELPGDWVQQMIRFQVAREQATRIEATRNVQISDVLREIAEEAGVDFRATINNFHVANGRADDAALEFNTRSGGRHQLKIPNWLWREWFKLPVDAITAHTEEMLRSDECRGVQKLFLVGGFSQSDFVRSAINDLFDDEFDEKLELVIPVRPEVAVTMGCLWAAHKKVTNKLVPFSYGYAFERPYRRGDDIERRRPDPSFPSGYKTIKCFGTLWEKGDEYTVGDEQKYEFPLNPGQREVQINVHRSEENPAPWFIPLDEDPVISFTYHIPPQSVSAREQTLDVRFELADGDSLKCNIFVRNDTGGSGTLRKFVTDFPPIDA